ncbi:Na+/H+ antiporter NhaA [Nocardioides yefusunii]|uniref:Na(+)/H(+) antiporter NhaA n=1 Tax=Nocardioides yefusunii TaxID=2500546 RepID=A0ABW1QWH0_9ACTN|nr:Na+/H+ antiporter NhaA [Nocardioides yefusunii]
MSKERPTPTRPEQHRERSHAVPKQPSGPLPDCSARPADDAVWNTGPVWTASGRPVARGLARPVREFLRISSAGSILLLLAAVAALVWVNSPWGDSYTEFWTTPVSFGWGDATLTHSLHHWVNDALMVIFFFVVGLEIKYELVHGDLRDPRAAALPMIAALGGMLIPAGIFFALNAGSDGVHGWGIPMATDIAFAVGVIGLLGRRIPSPARLFLLTLAVVDDIGAILVIAFFYTADLQMVWLALAIAGLAVVYLMQKVRIWSRWAYLLVGVGVWFALLESGVHATLAGVALGLMTPATPLLKPDVARRYAAGAIADNDLDPDEVARLKFLLEESVPTNELLQSKLHPFSSYVVLPVFALANAGVPLSSDALEAALTSSVAWGVVLGLVIGKPLGIALFTWLAVKFGVGNLPAGANWPMMVGLGAVGGIGFTVSLFISELSYPGHLELTDAAKIGIIFASLVAAAIGVALLMLATRGRAPDETSLNA